MKLRDADLLRTRAFIGGPVEVSPSAVVPADAHGRVGLLAVVARAHAGERLAAPSSGRAFSRRHAREPAPMRCRVAGLRLLLVAP